MNKQIICFISILFALCAGCSSDSGSSGGGVSAAALQASTPVSLAVDPATLTLPKGQTFALTAQVTRKDQRIYVYNTLVSWSSEDISVAKVSNDPKTAGVVTAIGAGTTFIRAYNSDWKLSARIQITVVNAVIESLQVTPSFPAITQWDLQNFIASATYSDGSIADITAQVRWESSDDTLLSFDSVNAGEATSWNLGRITVRATDVASGIYGETVAVIVPAATGYTASVASESGKTLYPTCDNKITLDIRKNGVPVPFSLSVTNGSASIADNGGGEFAVKPQNFTTLNITPQVTDPDGSTTTLDPLVYNVYAPPNPEIQIGTITGEGSMDKSELMNLYFISAPQDAGSALRGCVLNYRIASFVMAMNVNGVNVEYKTSSSSLSGDMRRMLSNAQPDDIINFKQISVITPWGSLINPSPVVIRVK